MKRKISVTNYGKELIFAKLNYMLALIKLMIAEAKYYNSLYATKNNEKIQQVA